MPGSKDPNLRTSRWPKIDDDYVDEFGRVDPEVYEIATQMWPSVEGRILQTINDLDTGQRLLLKAVAIASRRRREQPEQMTNLRAYLFVIFNRLLSAESKRLVEHGHLDAKFTEESNYETRAQEVDIQQTILVREILQRADDWTREVFEYLILGHTFEDLALKFGGRANVLRSKWSKRIATLRAQIERETRSAQQAILRKSRK